MLRRAETKITQPLVLRLPGQWMESRSRARVSHLTTLATDQGAAGCSGFRIRIGSKQMLYFSPRRARENTNRLNERTIRKSFYT